MKDHSTSFTNLLPEQEAIRAKCFHPSGKFVEFPLDDVETSIPERFEKIVRMYPKRLAVKAGDRALKYAELNQQANRVANVILEQFGDKIRPIIVMTDHSLEAIIACLGVLKAGKIMVPADPLFPLDRLAFMADDSMAEAVLTYEDNFNVAKQLASQGRKVVNASTIRNDISPENIGFTHRSQDPSDVRYTSGSTGRPKGVVNSHRKRMFECMIYINTGHICPEDRLITLRRLSFSPTDTLAGLLAGAALFPLDIKKHRLQCVGNLLHNEQITYFVSTPSVFRCIAQELTGREEFPHLRMVNLGGEPLFRSDVELYKRYFPKNCTLLNQLSGSEMGAICQYWITKETRIDTTIVPVGYPVKGKQVVLLDDGQKQVGVNETGEIAVTSRYLSNGYWNNSQLTKNKFFASQRNSDGRMYLSGDIGRMLPDGRLLYIGRKDDQVKINGAKVEIGEVEAVLSEHVQIRQTAVISLDRKSGDKYLTAYVVPRCDPAPTVSDLKDYLRRKLPDYMIPSAFVFLDALPLTNGKLDRKALLKPDDKRPALSQPYMSARSDVEITLVQIWEDVLNIHPIGVYDNFFHLGGHSLKAMQVVARVIKNFQVDLQLQSLFQSSTVAEMAAVITEHQVKQLPKEAMEYILGEIELMTEQEAQRLVAKEKFQV